MDVEELSKVAKEEPQNAYTAFTKGLCHRWTFLQRTIENVSEFFEPLEIAIRTKLIPALVGRDISDLDRRILALPLRHGGLGIQNPVLSSDHEFRASTAITAEMQTLIYNQDPDLRKINHSAVELSKYELKLAKEARFKKEYQDIMVQLPKSQKRALEQATSKGASSWLSALPLKSHGFCLNKSEFSDGIALRYNWQIPNVHSYCA